MTDTNRLTDKVAVITGSSSGMGKGTSLRIAEEDAAVAILDIRLPLAEAVAAEINDAGGRAVAIACDVAEETQVAYAIATTVDRIGKVTSLLANAGTAGRGRIHQTTAEDWNFVLGLNLTGPPYVPSIAFRT